jgi:uncharacterized protein YecA (UPF0149 family)
MKSETKILLESMFDFANTNIYQKGEKYQDAISRFQNSILQIVEQATSDRTAMVDEYIGKLKAKLKKASAGEVETWGFVNMFMIMIDECRADL